MAFDEVVCIASGPSLTREDCRLVDEWSQFGRRGVIVCNSAYQFAPFADVVYACDRKWLETYADKVPRGMLKISHAEYPGVVKATTQDVKNSGANMIPLAQSFGARKIILLGYDLQLTGGKTHCHGDHPPGLGNAASIASWPEKFARVAHIGKVVSVVNASRVTALSCFSREPLETALGIGAP